MTLKNKIVELIKEEKPELEEAIQILSDLYIASWVQLCKHRGVSPTKGRKMIARHLHLVERDFYDSCKECD